jgi:hypothetical protein
MHTSTASHPGNIGYSLPTLLEVANQIVVHFSCACAAGFRQNIRHACVTQLAGVGVVKTDQIDVIRNLIGQSQPSLTDKGLAKEFFQESQQESAPAYARVLFVVI